MALPTRNNYFLILTLNLNLNCSLWIKIKSRIKIVRNKKSAKSTNLYIYFIHIFGDIKS